MILIFALHLLDRWIRRLDRYNQPHYRVFHVENGGPVQTWVVPVRRPPLFRKPILDHAYPPRTLTYFVPFKEKQHER